MKLHFSLARPLITTLLFFAAAQLKAVIIAPGSENDPNVSFSYPISSAAFHPPSATWVVGSNGAPSDQGTTGNSKTQCPVMKAVLNSTSAPFNFSGLTTSAKALKNATIPNPYVQNICFATPYTNPTRPWIVYTATTDDSVNPKHLYDVSIDNLIANQSKTNGQAADLVDAANATTAKINSVTAGFGSYTTTQGVTSSTTQRCFIFSLVKKNGSTNLNQWGVEADTAGDGVSFALLDESSGQMNILNAQNASTTTFNAQLINKDYVQLGGTSYPLIVDKTTAPAPSTPVAPFPNACCYWDSQLARLYIGIPSLTTGGNAGDKACALLIARLTTNNTLFFLKPVELYTAFNSNTQIVGTVGAAQNIGIMNLNVMHTSTGFAYLIIYGGNNNTGTDQPAQLRQVFAIPLVQPSALPDNTIVGTLAKNDLTTPDFSVQASVPADLATIFSLEAKVGAGLLPIASTSIVSSMQIVNDTVFVGTQTVSNAVEIETPAIYYSQAIFNEHGKITRWTDWTIAAPLAIGNNDVDGSTSFMAVNALTGNIMGINSSTQTVASSTAWSNNKNKGAGAQQSFSLFTQLSNDLTDGCFSFFDFNQSSTIYGKHTTYPNVLPRIDLPPARLGLFGGKGKVIFTRPAYVKSTTAGLPPNYQYIDSGVATVPAPTYVQPQQPTKDFTTLFGGILINYMVTTLPSDTSMVTALGFTSDNTNQPQDTADGFFLAGTVKGNLYAWANTTTGAGPKPCGSTGFYFTNFGPLDPTTFSWQQVPGISGVPMKIESKGNSTYILTRATGPLGVMIDTLYRIPALLTTVADLGANAVIIATSSTGSLSAATQFLDFCIVSINTVTGAGPNLIAITTQEQILLATDHGLFISQKVNGVQAAVSQADAVWTAVPQNISPTSEPSLLYIYNMIFSPNRTRNPQSPIVAYNRDGFLVNATTGIITDSPGTTLEHSTLQQFCFSTNTTTSACIPATDYTSSDTTFFPELSPIQKYWSDGGRRLYIAQPPVSDGTINALYSLPFNVGTEAVTYPTDWYAVCELRPLQSYLQNTLTFYWISMVGDSGVIMAGTNRGVIALE